MQGPIAIRLYDPASAASFAVPLGLYVDRLSAVMLVLISGVGTIIYVYSVKYMYQDPQERRYLFLIGFATFVLLCMVSSANLVMLFVFWQLLSYLLYLLAHNHGHAATLAGAYRTFTLLRVGDVAFLAGSSLPISCTARWNSRNSLPRLRIRLSRCRRFQDGKSRARPPSRCSSSSAA